MTALKTENVAALNVRSVDSGRREQRKAWTALETESVAGALKGACSEERFFRLPCPCFQFCCTLGPSVGHSRAGLTLWVDYALVILVLVWHCGWTMLSSFPCWSDTVGGLCSRHSRAGLTLWVNYALFIPVLVWHCGWSMLSSRGCTDCALAEVAVWLGRTSTGQ